MSTDIHGFVEVQSSFVDGSEPEDDEPFLRWHPAMALDHVFDGRSYAAFGCLFGVRGRSFEPPRGPAGVPAGRRAGRRTSLRVGAGGRAQPYLDQLGRTVN
ncbi:hypothetical protein [Streptomyces sp. bgisy032]|uniref:hypothetical protein n=1 Tax=Streptomyces sp. bgisy032 TaxID=3413773 RepID=UPI003D71E8DA